MAALSFVDLTDAIEQLDDRLMHLLAITDLLALNGLKMAPVQAGLMRAVLEIRALHALAHQLVAAHFAAGGTA